MLVTRDDAAAEVVQRVVEESGAFDFKGAYQDLSQVRGQLSPSKIQAVIVDIDPDPPQILRSVASICHVAPETLVLVVCESLKKELLLEAMRAGARHFLEKKKLADNLLEELLSVIPNGEEKKHATSGSVVVPVFSAGGGCGATTIAINLASELRILSERPVLAIDLDVCYGAVSTYLGIKSKYGISNVLDPKKNVIDADLVRSSAYTYKEDFHVLTSPADGQSMGAGALPYENLTPALEACRRIYGYTVIDAPRLPQAAFTDLGKLSDLVVVAFQLTVKDVNTTRLMVSSLVQAGIARERIIPLANRVKKRGPLVRFEDTKRALGLSSCISIRSDWRKAMKSANHAKPLAEAARRSRLRRDIREFAVNVRSRKKNGRVKV
jgi:pilus assembly protein CpaE